MRISNEATTKMGRLQLKELIAEEARKREEQRREAELAGQENKNDLTRNTSSGELLETI